MRPRKPEHSGISNGGVLQGFLWQGKMSWEDIERLLSCWDSVMSTSKLTSHVKCPIHCLTEGVICDHWLCLLHLSYPDALLTGISLGLGPREIITQTIST